MTKHHRNPVFSGLFLIAAAVSCGAPPAPLDNDPVVKLEDCPRLAIFEDETELAAGLPVLYKQHLSDLIVIETSVYLNTCSKHHLAGAQESSRVGGAGEASKLAGAGEKSKIGGAGEKSKIGGAGEASKIGGAAEASRLADAAEKSALMDVAERSRVADASETSRSTSVAMSSKLAGAVEASKVAELGEASRVGGVSENSKIGSASSACRCHKSEVGIGYQLQGIARGRLVRVYDGVELRRYVDGKFVD
jgi:hypothetical protein